MESLDISTFEGEEGLKRGGGGALAEARGAEGIEGG